jgi:hypothetical protein
MSAPRWLSERIAFDILTFLFGFDVYSSFYHTHCARTRVRAHEHPHPLCAHARGPARALTFLFVNFVPPPHTAVPALARARTMGVIERRRGGGGGGGDKSIDGEADFEEVAQMGSGFRVQGLHTHTHIC